jgi:hypothetical protein
LVPSPESGDDFVWFFGPGEGFGIMAGLCDEAVDSGLKIDHSSEDATLQSLFGKFAKNPSIALSHEHEVGVKWSAKLAFGRP